LLEPGVFDVPHTGSTHLSATQHLTAHSVPLHHGLRSRASPAPLQCQTSTLIPPKPKRKLRRLQESDSGIDFEPVSLILPTKPSLADLGNLSKEEERAGRRLVAFDRKVVGDTVQLSYRRISPEEYSEKLFVISCIYHRVTLKDEKDEEILTRERWFTSVEILKLVEYIADGESSSIDKSRNRRNLEFIKPTTVSRAALPQFFQLLMDFPIPKPRGIEKDIKAFPWDSLEAGLKKVMEKYVRSSLLRFFLCVSSLTITFASPCPNDYHRPGFQSRSRSRRRPPHIPVLYFRNLRINSMRPYNIQHRITTSPPYPPYPTTLPIRIHHTTTTTWGNLSRTTCQTCPSTHAGYNITAIDSGWQ
jgi:hypothetical protein